MKTYKRTVRQTQYAMKVATELMDLGCWFQAERVDHYSDEWEFTVREENTLALDQACLKWN